MISQTFHHATSWYRALTLTERALLTRGRSNPRQKGSQPSSNAHRRLQRWKSQKPFSNPDVFHRRLELDGITEEELLALLDETAAPALLGVPDGAEDWTRFLTEAFARHAPAGPSLVEAISQHLLENQRPLAGLFTFIAPLIEEGRHQLRQGIASLLRESPQAPFDAEVEKLLLPMLPNRLLWMMHRPLILELNVCRIQGMLKGETPEARFDDFLRLLAQPEFSLKLLQEYPVLARQLIHCIQQWVRFSLEFLSHLRDDQAALVECFGAAALQGRLSAISGGMGDSHREGRAVLFATLGSGTRLVYKPRSLAVEVHFQQLLEALNQWGMQPAFRTIKVVDRETHGWAEFITASGCETEAEVERFYERQGGFLALLHAIRATDFHAENLIAAGEHPVLTDLEALFHPPPQRHLQTWESQASRWMKHSVLSVGLLPGRAWLESSSNGLEISGLAGGLSQPWPHLSPVIAGAGTDQMHLVKKQLMSSACSNRPTLRGEHVDVARYDQALQRGFQRLYQLLLDHREDLRSAQGLLARFDRDEIRVVLRTTFSYAYMIRESSHPNLLRDALERDRLFDALWIDAADMPKMQRVLPAERMDLELGDVPLFTTRPDSRDLWTSKGERIADFFEESALERVHRHLDTLSKDDLERQLWFIRASFTTLAMGEETAAWGQVSRSAGPHATPPREATPEALLAAARDVADRLEHLAIRGADDVGWVGLTLVNDKHWTLVPTYSDLYSGNAGIALFLGYLGEVTREPRYTALARLALDSARKMREVQRDQLTQVGMGGWGGFIYALTHLGRLWHDPVLLQEAEASVALLASHVSRDVAFDILDGSAGAILPLLGLGSPAALAAAVKCGERLLESARPMSVGMGWHVKSVAPWPLTGLAHGTAGIALALLALASATAEARFRDVALQALDYERDQFSPEARNWADLRLPEDTPVEKRRSRFSAGWCHGAPGIGMARVSGLRHLDDARVQEEIDAALEATWAYGFGRNQSLCHGALGNLELPLMASRARGDAALRQRTYAAAGSILDGVKTQGLLCGVPLGVETPGLMTGLAGIGYGFLRLAHPERIPSLLTLEAPKGR